LGFHHGGPSRYRSFWKKNDIGLQSVNYKLINVKLWNLPIEARNFEMLIFDNLAKSRLTGEPFDRSP